MSCVYSLEHNYEEVNLSCPNVPFCYLLKSHKVNHLQLIQLSTRGWSPSTAQLSIPCSYDPSLHWASHSDKCPTITADREEEEEKYHLSFVPVIIKYLLSTKVAQKLWNCSPLSAIRNQGQLNFLKTWEEITLSQNIDLPNPKPKNNQNILQSVVRVS